jgi:hypothetical protein
MPCNCGNRRMRAFIVTDALGECLIADGSGCTVFPTSSAANRAARTAGLAEWQVRPQ